MRPQQNRRMRGRGGGGGNRKSPNPLTRSYESNGPDVKIRGTAQQVAEKYATLARDAQSSGDRVMAENYLQHAEHYNRLIAAALAQTQQARPRDERDDDDEDRDDQELQATGEDQSRQDTRHDNGAGRSNGSGPQPVIEGTPAEVALERGDLAEGKGAKKAQETKANGSADREEQAEAAGEGEQPQRRARRPRRPRAKPGDAEAQADRSEDKSDDQMAEVVNS